tara:strand:+ start:20 stop:511 length:492 start_codon:yes stop_codon:yes gene_type:complete
MKKLLLILLYLPMVVLSQTSHTVNTGMLYYNPDFLTINIGDTVFWINDGGNHNVNFVASSVTNISFNNPEEFISTPTTDINIHSHVFTIAGTYQYDCSVYGHASGGMTGTIIVNNISYTNQISSNKRLLKIINTLGRNISYKKNQPLFYIYDDGTVEKRITID